MNEEKTAYEGFEKEHNWTHISGIWDLPYAKALKLPHNIDVMHQERNVAESIISTCMDFSDKAKDNVKAQKDLAKICKRPTLELTASGAKVGGLVQFRWMFHIERALKYLRAMVGNKARVEGCIAEAFILKEISYFSSCKEIDGKVHKDLVQLSEGRVSVRSHGRYDVNGFHFRSAPFEAAHPLAATCNSGVMVRASDDQGKESNYYGIIQNILEFKFIGDKELKLVFFVCDWFEPNRGVIENQYGMVEVKHNEKLKENDNWVLAHQCDQVYYPPYPNQKLHAWWVVQKVNPRERLYTPRHVDYYNQFDDEVDEVFQEEELPTSVVIEPGVELNFLGEEDEEAEGEDAGDRQEDEEAGDGQEDAQADEELMGGDGSEEVVQRRGTRRSHYVNPPSIPATADKKLIKPIGDSQWEDVTWDGIGHRRTPNGLLGNLICVHNPGVVEKNGETIPVTTWKHFALAPHVTYGSVQGLKYYCVNPSEQDHANKVLKNAANKICKDLFSNLRIQVTNSWLKSQRQPVGRFRDASETYLTAEEYGSPGPYKALCDLRASEEFQERSRKHRNAGTKNATHKLGGDGYRRKAQRLAEYGKEMERRYGEGFDWRTAPVDPQAVYESGGGKSHGWYSMFNGMIDSRQV
ncbi:hypothetical protein U9M48_024578 [Paspalum notatum var. saurae]|uniref:DUF4216 domain-containing protein n=1 Tax=Paspalum notatum var. saurae TaxID=547442 RepID=A0AAQ3WX88_PASNO